MIKWFFRLLFRLHGWKLDKKLPEYGDRAVMIAAPHTSNWDFIYTIACFDMLGIPMRFTIKQEWLKWPFKKTMIRLGALGIDRSPRAPGEERPSMVQIMTELFRKHDKLILTVTPEGTRKKRTKWKTGFYHVAREAGVPILCGYLDYKEKKAGVGLLVQPSDDMAADMKRIMDFYKTKHPKNPELFSIDLDYA